jgi:hypothetical protein
MKKNPTHKVKNKNKNWLPEVARIVFLGHNNLTKDWNLVNISAS